MASFDNGNLMIYWPEYRGAIEAPDNYSVNLMVDLMRRTRAVDRSVRISSQNGSIWRSADRDIELAEIIAEIDAERVMLGLQARIDL